MPEYFFLTERAVLTPEPRWGFREQVLRQRFVVAPADARAADDARAL